MGKSCGSGLPLGMVIGKNEIIECLNAHAHAFTLSGNATVCVAALKMIEVFELDNIIE